MVAGWRGRQEKDAAEGRRRGRGADEDATGGVRGRAGAVGGNGVDGCLGEALAATVDARSVAVGAGAKGCGTERGARRCGSPREKNRRG